MRGVQGSSAANGSSRWKAALFVGLAVPVATVALSVAGIGAWACIPQARLVVITPQASGPAGSQVIVQGIGFDSPPSSTEIRWNTAEGPVLGKSDQADFALAVTVPEAPPGSYGILVMSRGADGVLGNTGRATFEVTTGQPPPIGSTSPAPGATPTSSPGPTFAPAPTVVVGDSGPSGLTLALAAMALVAAGVFVGTLVPPRSRPTPMPALDASAVLAPAVGSDADDDAP